MKSADIAHETLTLRLRNETRDAHERVEAALEPMMRTPTIEQYIELLSRWRAFFLYWEPAVRSVMPAELAEDFDSRRKLPWIDQDLLALQAAPVDCTFAAGRLSVRQGSDALGGIYVIEGSTLGGQVICKRFADALALTPQKGLRYFDSYGSQTAAHWRQTKELLNHPRWVGEHDSIIESARRTFAALTEFFSAPLPSIAQPFRTV